MGRGIASLAGFAVAGAWKVRVAGQYAYLDGVIAGIDTSQFESLDDLVSAITAMREAAADLESGLNGLVALVDGQIVLVQQMDSLNAAALADAVTLAARYPADAEAQALLSRLGQLDAMYDQLLSTSAPGLPYLRDQLAQILPDASVYVEQAAYVLG